MAGVDRDAPVRFLGTIFEPTDWAAIFLKSYEKTGVVQRVALDRLFAYTACRVVGRRSTRIDGRMCGTFRTLSVRRLSIANTWILSGRVTLV